MLGGLGQKVSSSSEPAGGQGLQRLLVLSSFRKVTEHPATTQVSIGLTLLPGREAFVVTYRWPGFMKEMFAHNFLRVRGFLSLPCVCMLSHSVLSNSLQPFGLHPTRLLHPCNPLDCIPPGFSVHGIFQARILEWVAISCSKSLPDPGTEPLSPVSPALQADSVPTEPSGES